MFKCYEIFTVALWMHVCATVIFLGFSMHFCYVFINSLNYPNKLTKEIK
jgi:uncharacterized membrane protein